MKNTRITIGFIFMLTDLISHVISSSIGKDSPYYWIYYALVGVIDTYVIYLLCKMDDEQWIAELMIINFIAVLTHIYGGIIWWRYYPPDSYDYAIEALSAVQWMRLILVNKNDKTPIRNSGVYKYVHRVRAINFDWLSLYKK